MTGIDPSMLDPYLRQVSLASAALIDAIRTCLDGHLEAAKTNGSDISLPEWGDDILARVWEKMNAAGMMKNPPPLGILAFAQAIEDITHHINGPAWAKVHKGVHYYNVGLALTAMMELDRAFKFFLLADEQDERNKGARPGDIFRTRDIFAGLREHFFDPWLSRTLTDYHHHSCEAPSDRRDLLVRVLAALPGRHVLARCHLGVF